MDRVPESLGWLFESDQTERPTRAAVLLSILDATASRSTCPRLRVGAILIKNRALVGTAYNGAPSGLPHCHDEGCIVESDHCVRATHAEQNLIAQCALEGISTKGALLLVTHQPCAACAKIIIRSGINQVIYVRSYGSYLGTSFMERSGIEVYDGFELGLLA